jgi:hypothetical protein
MFAEGTNYLVFNHYNLVTGLWLARATVESVNSNEMASSQNILYDNGQSMIISRSAGAGYD